MLRGCDILAEDNVAEVPDESGRTKVTCQKAFLAAKDHVISPILERIGKIVCPKA